MNFRLRLFSYHLLFSVVLASISIFFVFFIWYPSPLHSAAGVTEIFLILLSVDVVLGPILTLLVSKEGKKSLKLDVSVILVLQIAALFYGISTVAKGRPVWIVFNVDRFDMVQAYQVDESYRQKARPEYQSFSWSGPKWIAARKPLDVAAQNNLVFESVFGGVDMPLRPDLYVPYENELSNIKVRALQLSALYKYNQAQNVEKVLAEWPNANAYLPMMARLGAATVLINTYSGSVVAVVPLNPW